MNYSADIKLTDVLFTSIDEGWVTGEHGTILHTSNGGANWSVQVGGDPNNQEKTMGHLDFLDRNHGWAVQEDTPPRLLRTQDGQKWEAVNANFPPGTPVIDLKFTSTTHGILLGGNGDAIYLTNDGGQNWKLITPCKLNVTAQGLALTKDCHFWKLRMLSEKSGFAFAHWDSPEAPNDASLAIFKTDDTGETWNPLVLPIRGDAGQADFFFTDAQHGVVVFHDGKTYTTADGGKNWHALLAMTVGPIVEFADPEVGWGLGASKSNWRAGRISYTTDGGQHWQNSGEIKFPIDWPDTLKFSFPRRDRAYIIGPHGMVYRYRIVPQNYTAANILPAPLMPALHN